MIDNSQDKGYTMVRLKQVGSEWHMTEIGFEKNPDETNFYADYENGTIYIDLGNGNKNTIGFYAPAASGPYNIDVYDRTRSRIIGRVGGELILFRAREADYSVGRYSPEEECLAYYSETSGSIRRSGEYLTMSGCIEGNALGGAAAFIALSYYYNFHSVYREYFDLDSETFKKKYPSLFSL